MPIKQLLNRRNSQRAHAFVNACIHTECNEDDNEALILNISTGGAMLLSNLDLKISDTFSLSLIIPDKKIIFVHSELRWKCGDMLGIKFIDLDIDDKDVLMQLINDNDKDNEAF